VIQFHAAPQSSLRALLLAAMLRPLCATVAWAGDTQAEFVPELNAYLRLSEDTRLYLLGDLTQNLSESTTDGEVGVHLDITLKPILRRRLREADWERNAISGSGSGSSCSGTSTTWTTASASAEGSSR
jgi:hypothetical protein